MLRAIPGCAGVVTLLLAASVVSVPQSSAAAEVQGGRGLSATIRYTEYGVPHISARDYPGLGFGTGYAAAKDNICLLAQRVVTLRGERSRYFGATAAPDRSMSSARTNLASDVFFTSINDSAVIERLLKLPYPYGPRQEVRELNRGWVAGYNTYLREGKITDPACAGARWLRPVTELDQYRHMYALTLLGGSGGLVDQVLAAQPPSGTGGARSQSPQEAARAARALLSAVGTGGAGDMGSNAFAVGGKATANGRGLLLGNPHYPWHGGRRYWQMQQTIPGKLNVSGATLPGWSSVAIGYNAAFAWSHTVATGRAFSVAQLRLVPGDPTAYLVDGRRERLTQRRITVQAREPDGSLKPVTRSQWWTRYGPIITSAGSIELPWTASSAFALSDPNRTNLRLSNSSFELGTARTTDEAIGALKRTQGLPWVNTIAADSRGRALYAQLQVLPNITDEFAARCNTPLGKLVFAASGLAILDGSTAACTPGRAPGTVQPGILSPDRYPVMERPDFVTNSNNSYWLTNPARPLEGFDRIIGDERTARSLRTRSGLVSVTDQLAKGRFTRAAMQDLALANRVFAAELAAEDTVEMCRELRLGEACDVLQRWDRRNDVGSRGALLFDRYWRRAEQTAGPGLWKVPFNVADPVNTPRGLNTGAPAVRKALTDAVAELKASGIPLNTPLGEHQYVVRNGEKIAIGGGAEELGVLNQIEATWTPGKGYTEVEGGSSYIQVVSLDGDPCPDARTLLTFSQSADPTSPHHADQTRLFSRKQWVTGRFCEKDINASPALKVIKLNEH